MVKKGIWIGILAALLAGCSGKKPAPEVSGIKVKLETIRFENDFFRVDTLHINESLQSLNNRHPGFTQDFLFNIMGTSPDSAHKDVPRFISTYQTLYRDAAVKFAGFGTIEKQLHYGFQLVHYYFPQYRLPEKIITFIGPINSYGSIITPDALAIGLQLYMGADYPLYLSDQGQQMYPRFISRRFEPAYIPVNGLKNIIDDMYPNNSAGRPLVEQMVESGKRVWLLQKLLPDLPDTLITGYSAAQLKGCEESEKNIWSFFVQNDMLFKTDPNLNRDYMSDGPNTPALGEASPGNIGTFVGWQIVKKWLDRQPDTITPDKVMKTNPKTIFDESKYKPR